MAPRENANPIPGGSWLQHFFRPVQPETLSSEERFEYTQFISRVRSFAMIKGCVNALILILYLFTVLPEWPATVLVALVDGLLLVPYLFLVRRWPALTTTALLTMTALAISAADAVSGYQTATSGVLYAVLIAGGAVILLHTRSIMIIATSITCIYLVSHLLEWFGVVPVDMSIITPQGLIRVLALHTLAFLSVGAISGVLTHLYQQLLRTRSQHGLLTALLEGFDEISGDLDLHTLLERIAERAVSTIPASDRAILLVQEDNRMVIRGASGYTPWNPLGVSVPLGRVVASLEAQPSQITDLHERLPQFISGADLASALALPASQVTAAFPLHSKEDVLGVLLVSNTSRPDAFNADVRQILDLFAHQAAVAIDNARLFAESQSRLQEALALHSIGQEIASLLQMHDLIPTIYRHIRQVMEAPSFVIALQDPHTNDLVLISPIDGGDIFPDTTISSEGVLGWVTRHKQPLRCGNLPQDLRAHPEIQPQPFGHVDLECRSLLAVPLTVESEVIGALSVQSPKSEAYDKHDEQFLSSLASYVAVAVQNARLYDEVQRKRAELQGLIAAVSHRLQGPVEALSGFARLLKDGARSRLTPAEDDYLERIERNSRWIFQLVQDMLFLSRLGLIEEETEPISLPTLIRGLSTHLELRQQGISLSIQEDMPVVYADPVLMWAFFSSLLHNASRLLEGVESAHLKVGCDTPDDAFRLYIQGNGQALPPEKLERIFELFFPIGPPEGAGIGLSIAQRIGQRYGARLWAESEAGNGTTFYVLLPRALATKP